MRPEQLRQKQAVSDALTNALRKTRLKDWLDPNGLAATLESKFDVLYDGTTLDLEPLWASLSAAYNPQALVGLFLRFRDEAERLGVRAKLPGIVERLPPEQRRAHIEHFDLVADLSANGPSPTQATRTADLTPLPTLEMLDPEPIPLQSSDLRPIIPEDLKRRVVHAVVQCVKGSPIGWRVNSAQLRQFVTQSFEKLCDGVHFDFEPILRALLADEGISEADAYIAVVRLIEQLRRQNIVMAEPPMKLTEELKARLWEEAMSSPGETRAASDVGQPLPGQHAIRLGDLLVKYQLISEAQLQQALRAQQMFGGRLGTNLIELGFIEETALAHFLSVQLDLPAISPGDLDRLSPQTLAVLPAEIAKKYKVIPLKVDKRKLKLAMLDPTDLEVIDEVSFLTGHRVQPVVAPEALVAYALEAYYGVPRAERRTLDVPREKTDDLFQVVHVSWRPNTNTRNLQREANAAARAATEAAEANASGPIATSRDLVLEVDRGTFLDVERPDYGPAPTALGDLASALARAVSAQDVHRALLDQLSRMFEQVAVFAPNGAEVIGLGQHGCRISHEHMAALRFPIQGSEFRQLYGNLRIHVGPSPSSTHDNWVLGSLGIPPGTPLVALPLVEKQRVVSFLLAAGRKVGDVYRDVPVYEKIAEKAGLAFQMISLRKQILEV